MLDKTVIDVSYSVKQATNRQVHALSRHYETILKIREFVKSSIKTYNYFYITTGIVSTNIALTGEYEFQLSVPDGFAIGGMREELIQRLNEDPEIDKVLYDLKFTHQGQVLRVTIRDHEVAGYMLHRGMTTVWKRFVTSKVRELLNTYPADTLLSKRLGIDLSEFVRALRHLPESDVYKDMTQLDIVKQLVENTEFKGLKDPRFVTHRLRNHCVLEVSLDI